MIETKEDSRKILIEKINASGSGFQKLIDRIAAIADTLAYPSDATKHPKEQGEWMRKGFLVSAYGIDKYRKLAESGRLFAALIEGEPVAFSVIYRPTDKADEGDLGTEFTREKFGPVPVVKQIATAREHEGRGFARLLNDHFAHQYPDLPVFAAIVEQPRNLRSERFHSILGFERCAEFDHPDGKLRGIWRRPPVREWKSHSSP